jgi:threonine/homoserine/homoserine lactone efflux protein
MLPIETLTHFSLASILLALSPGPDNIFVLMQSAIHGRLSGFAIILGLFTGILFHTMAVSLGVAVIFQTSVLAFTALKIAGVAYLLYLAFKAFFSPAAAIQEQKSQRVSLGKLYRMGVIMNITNPKVSLFFLAFLPQFTSPERGPVSAQVILLGAIFALAAFPVFGTIALLAGTIKTWLHRSPKAPGILNRIAGSVFVALALKLLTASQET